MREICSVWNTSIVHSELNEQSPLTNREEIYFDFLVILGLQMTAEVPNFHDLIRDHIWIDKTTKLWDPKVEGKSNFSLFSASLL